MCLSIPAKVLEIDGDSAKADCGGNIVACDLALEEGVEVGDYLLIHAGFAIQKYEPQEARDVLRMIREVLDENP